VESLEDSDGFVAGLATSTFGDHCSFRIGMRCPDWSSYGFEGLIDEVAVWNRALPASIINTVMFTMPGYMPVRKVRLRLLPLAHPNSIPCNVTPFWVSDWWKGLEMNIDFMTYTLMTRSPTARISSCLLHTLSPAISIRFRRHSVRAAYQNCINVSLPKCTQIS